MRFGLVPRWTLQNAAMSTSYGNPHAWESAPASMRAVPQWGVWKYTAEGRKVPHALADGRTFVNAHAAASVSTFEDAVQAADRQGVVAWAVPGESPGPACGNVTRTGKSAAG
jgi:hypothetical protein